MNASNGNLHNSSVSFIGSGVMGEAMIRALLKQDLLPRERIVASDPLADRLRELAATLGVGTTTDNREAASRADVLILSVKPQVLREVLEELRGCVRPETLVLSIVAGARVKAIARGLGGHEAIVRAMPNTPAQIGLGMTVWIATPAVTPEQHASARAILGAMGEELSVEDEDYLDMATALSGTGPAYVFLFMEALIDGGVHMGFSRRVAQQLVLKTMEGAVAIAKQTGQHPAVLRNAVTSPGGTSAEALYQLEKGALRTIVSKAIWAAYQKSKYLGGLSEE
jgi:pyrroline-5-carboxylate reductase